MCFGDNKQTSQTVQSLPPWAMEAAQRNVTSAEGIANRPYQGYDGQRVAGFNTDQTNAWGNFRDMAASGNPYAGAIEQLFGNYSGAPAQSVDSYNLSPWADSRSSAGWLEGRDNYNMPNVAGWLDSRDNNTPQALTGWLNSRDNYKPQALTGWLDGRDNVEFEKLQRLLPKDYQQIGGIASFMDPYLSGVLDPQLREYDRQAGQDRLSANKAATMAGAFGDTGHALLESENQRNLGERRGDAVSRAHSEAFRNAQTQRGNAIQTLLGAANIDTGRGVDIRQKEIDRLLGQKNVDVQRLTDNERERLNRLLSQKNLDVERLTTDQRADLDRLLGTRQTDVNRDYDLWRTNLDRSLGTRDRDTSRMMGAREGDRAVDLDTQKANASWAEQYLNRQRTGGQDLLGLDQWNTKRGTDLNSILRDIGNQQQGNQQKQLDTQYGDFREKRDWDMQMQQFISAILRGTPMPKTETRSAPDNSGFGMLGGGIGALLGGPFGGWLGKSLFGGGGGGGGAW